MKSIRNIFKSKILVWVLFVGFLLNSCETQEDLIKNDNRNTTVETVRLNTLKNKPPALENLEKKLERRQKSTDMGRSIYDSINAFELDEDFIKHIMAGDYESFTFSMKKENEEKIHNLLMSKNGDGTFATFLVRYAFTPEQLKLMSKAQIDQEVPFLIPVEFDENGKMTYRVANPTVSIICMTSWGITTNDGYSPCDHPGIPHENGQQCQSNYVITGYDCFIGAGGDTGNGDTGSNTGEPANPNNNPPNEPGGGNTNGNQNNTGSIYVYGYISTTPVVRLNTRIVNDNFKALLNADQLDWWENHKNMRDILLDYLCTEEPELEEAITNEDVAISNINGQMMGEQPETIIILFKKPCEGETVMGAFSQCSDLSETFLNIYAGTDKFNMKYEYMTSQEANSSANANVSAFTKRNGDMNVEGVITRNYRTAFKKSFLRNATDIAIARTAIHESMHAILLFLKDVEAINVMNGGTNPTYLQLLNAYCDHYLINNNILITNETQHQFVSDYVISIANSIKQYGISKGYDLPDSFYNALAWGGLTSTSAFLSQYPPTINGQPNPEYNYILGTIDAEDKNTGPYYPDGTPVLDTEGHPIYPHGNECP